MSFTSFLFFIVFILCILVVGYKKRMFKSMTSLKKDGFDQIFYGVGSSFVAFNIDNGRIRFGNFIKDDIFEYDVSIISTFELKTTPMGNFGFDYKFHFCLANVDHFMHEIFYRDRGRLAEVEFAKLKAVYQICFLCSRAELGCDNNTTVSGQLEKSEQGDKKFSQLIDMLWHVAQSMERSPNAFRGLNEDSIRQHILAHLNGPLKGAAMAEAFNVNGKTDILVRENGENIFIAECKFWKGPKHYVDSIDQILGYANWQDTRLAILIFNRGTTMTTVVNGINSETVRHKNFKRQLGSEHESSFRYVFHVNGDVDRELILFVLVFNLFGTD